MATREEAETGERFGRRYTRVAPVLAELEREVMGSDYGGSGYTSRAQADALAVLRACRRLLRDGGRTAFHVISVAPNLTAAQRRDAARSGPISVAARRDYPAMLGSAGFDDVEEIDVTADYRASLRALLDWSAGRERDLRAVLGDQLFGDHQNDRRLQLAGIDGGLLRRSMIIARVA